MIKFVIYSHTDYLDVLKIQTDYMGILKDKVLFINQNNLELTDLYKNYNNVIFYDDSLTYPSRVYSCLEQINDDYILFIHDIDILLNLDIDIIEEFVLFLHKNNYDRVDLKYCDKFNSNSNLIKFTPKKNNIEYDLMLIEQSNPSNYIYNVNPSIWKKSSFMDILHKFQHKNYRTIEDLDVQEYAKKYKIYKIFSNKKHECGYFICVDFFKFLHISHNGKYLPFNLEFKTIYGQSYSDVKFDYINIVENYKLYNSNRWYK